MSFSNQSNDYSNFGFEPINSDETRKSTETAKETNDYSNFGFEPEKRKAGFWESVGLGIQEGGLGLIGLLEAGRKKSAQTLKKYGLPVATQNPITREPWNPEEDTQILDYLASLPESEGQLARRARTGAAGITSGLPFGLPGIAAGLVGSQAGQTIREEFGKEGKFDKFGLGEASAIGTDILFGGGAGFATSATRNLNRAANQIPAVFQQPRNALQRATVKNAIQGDQQALQNIVDNFANNQIRGFEETASRISPDRYTQLVQSDASAIKRNAEGMFRSAILDAVNPSNVTKEQGGRALQQAANTIFDQNVIAAERNAYNAARQASRNLNGEAPQALGMAKALRNDLIKSTPTPEQNPVVHFLNGFIEDLETHVPASKIVNESGIPLIPAQTKATIRPANELVDLVQRANQAVNYDSMFREQSHRLKPIVNRLREEVTGILSKNNQALTLYQAANNLHGRNAETWGTNFMRSLRFSENPELIFSKMKNASNLRNFREAIPDPSLQSLNERILIDQITQSGSENANRELIRNLQTELTPVGRQAANELINVKDPLTNTGGRAAVRNEILKDAANSVNTGKRPDKILDLMQTPKGFNLVRESLNATQQSRNLFNSMQRLFLEDIFSSITDKTGRIDFSKARNILKNSDVRSVVQQIGGNNLVTRFNQLETYANNFARNIDFYKKPATQSLLKKLLEKSKNAGMVGLVLHALHVPIEVLAGVGIVKGVSAASKVTFDALKSKVLSNPKALRLIEQMSLTNSTEELSKQIPRLLIEIDKKDEKEK